MDPQAHRLEANCKKIWGAEKQFDIDIEADNPLRYPSYIGFVKEDYGLSFGSPLMVTGVCAGAQRAWDELDRMLALWAEQVESGQPMTKEKHLEISSGLNGEHRKLNKKTLNKKDEMERTAANMKGREKRERLAATKKTKT
jgi:hypothetical protein